MIRKCYKFYTLVMTLMWVMAAMTASAFAVDDMWTVANRIIVDVYTKIVGISTVLAGLMSAVAVIGACFLSGEATPRHTSLPIAGEVTSACLPVVTGPCASTPTRSPCFTGILIRSRLSEPTLPTGS